MTSGQTTHHVAWWTATKTGWRGVLPLLFVLLHACGYHPTYKPKVDGGDAWVELDGKGDLAGFETRLDQAVVATGGTSPSSSWTGCTMRLHLDEAAWYGVTGEVTDASGFGAAPPVQAGGTNPTLGHPTPSLVNPTRSHPHAAQKHDLPLVR